MRWPDRNGVPVLKDGEDGGESDPVNGRVRKFVCVYENNLKTQQKAENTENKLGLSSAKLSSSWGKLKLLVFPS